MSTDHQDGTGEFILVPRTGEFAMPRQKRTTFSPITKAVSATVGVVAVLITMGGLVWGMATLVTSKADKDDLKHLETEVEKLKLRIELRGE